METGYPVSDIMVQNIITVEPKTLISDCARIMADNKIGCIIVKEHNHLVGIITDQDLTRKVIATGISPIATPANKIMSRDIITIEPHRDLHDAIALMGTHEIKHLPVVQRGNLVGIITAKDILQIEPGLMELLSFKATMSEGEA